MKPQHPLSQVFLTDKKYIQRILDSVNYAGKNILEIGAGHGEMSKHFCLKAEHLYCVELDKGLCRKLEYDFHGKANVTVFCENILSLPIEKMDRKIMIYGNIPYHISKNIILYLIKYRSYINRAYLTVQKEFAAKLTAKPAESYCGYLSYLIQYHAEVKKLFDIPPSAFRPQPRVMSSFVEIKFTKKNIFGAKKEELLFKLIAQSCFQRRKKIINSLKLPEEIGDRSRFFYSLGIDPGLRPYELSLKDYITITKTLYP